MQTDRQKILAALAEKPLTTFNIMKRVNIKSQDECQTLLLKMRDEGAVAVTCRRGNQTPRHPSAFDAWHMSAYDPKRTLPAGLCTQGCGKLKRDRRCSCRAAGRITSTFRQMRTWAVRQTWTRSTRMTGTDIVAARANRVRMRP